MQIIRSEMYEMVRFLYEIKTRHLRVASGERCMQNKIAYFLFLCFLCAGFLWSCFLGLLLNLFELLLKALDLLLLVLDGLE